eukprot:697652-Pyramimonas_sp.AAC.1
MQGLGLQVVMGARSTRRWRSNEFGTDDRCTRRSWLFLSFRAGARGRSRCRGHGPRARELSVRSG